MPNFNANARACVTSAVLMMLAHPYSLSQTEFKLMRALARQLGARVRYRIDDGSEAGKTGPWPSLTRQGSTLRMDTRALVDEMKRLVAELEAGYTPESLGFDKRVSRGTVIDTLRRLVPLWRTPYVAPPARRAPVHNYAKAVTSWHAIAAGLQRGQYDPTSSVAYTQSVYEYRRSNMVQAATVDPSAVKMAALFKSAELWNVDGENALGFSCRRIAMTPRVNLGQLVILSFGASEPVAPGQMVPRRALFLGHIDAVNQDPKPGIDDETVQEIGVRLLLGTPLLVGVKMGGTGFEDAYLLRTPPPGQTSSGLGSLPIEAHGSSLVLPLARWQEGDITEMMADGATHRVQFTALMHRGQDFDQVAFTLL
jgi:hypothetical protein